MTIQSIAVIGSGVMGRGISLAAGLAGYAVTLYDVNEAALADARNFVSHELRQGVERGKVPQEKADQVLKNLSYASQLEDAVTKADLVIEAVPEILELKTELLSKIDGLCDEHVILATNTSTMSPSEMASATNRPDRVVAMHFFNPAHKMKLIEIIRGLDTSSSTVERIQHVCRRMGKEPVEVAESPGFIAGRISCLLGNEAMNMLMEGVASAADIDRAVRLGLGHPMGPLELADLVGLDARLRNVAYLHDTLGERFLPSPLLRKYVHAGRLGRKTGRGFYAYDENGRILPEES